MSRNNSFSLALIILLITACGGRTDSILSEELTLKNRFMCGMYKVYEYEIVDSVNYFLDIEKELFSSLTDAGDGDLMQCPQSTQECRELILFLTETAATCAELRSLNVFVDLSGAKLGARFSILDPNDDATYSFRSVLIQAGARVVLIDRINARSPL